MVHAKSLQLSLLEVILFKNDNRMLTRFYSTLFLRLQNFVVPRTARKENQNCEDNKREHLSFHP